MGGVTNANQFISHNAVRYIVRWLMRDWVCWRDAFLPHVNSAKRTVIQLWSCPSVGLSVTLWYNFKRRPTIMRFHQTVFQRVYSFWRCKDVEIRSTRWSLLAYLVAGHCVTFAYWQINVMMNDDDDDDNVLNVIVWDFSAQTESSPICTHCRPVVLSSTAVIVVIGENFRSKLMVIMLICSYYSCCCY